MRRRTGAGRFLVSANQHARTMAAWCPAPKPKQRTWWVLDPKRAEKFRYAVAVHQGITRGVWEITPGPWRPSTLRPDGSTRWSFDGTPAPPDIVDAFVGANGKRIPRFREDGRNVFGQANPIGYWP